MNPSNTRGHAPAVADNVLFVASMAALYVGIQSVVVVAHEFAHSTTAWLLGYTSTPFTVVWGNPITMLGWDEGVPYDQLFASGGRPAEAAIGGMPLLMHAVFIILALIGLQRVSITKHKLSFYALYWFLVVNLTEMVAYLWMRPFIPTGDTGRFNQGFSISPWYLFVAGSLLLVWAFFIVLTKVMPRLDVVGDGSRAKHAIFVWMTAFLMVLWGSGLRIMTLYPDHQWRWGLIGLVLAPLWVLADRLRMDGASPSVTSVIEVVR
jgi:hypothetical protein